MNAVETIYHKKHQIAVVIRADFNTKDVSFLSDHQDFFQLGFFYRKKGYTVPAHYHTPREKVFLSELSECIQVKRGKIKITYFSKDLKVIAEVMLSKGDTVLHTTAIHKVEFIQNSLILELKQGPYDHNSKHYLEKK